MPAAVRAGEGAIEGVRGSLDDDLDVPGVYVALDAAGATRPRSERGGRAARLAALSLDSGAVPRVLRLPTTMSCENGR